ncbi:MAG: TadE family protein [Chloroflexota bacterium]|nr:TadE family protein [Chloroflexota bacterium]
MKTNTRLFKRKERAQGMLEFALVLPIVLLLVFGVIEFGRLLFIYSAVTTASREAVRYGSAVDDASGTYQFADCAGIQAAATRIGSLVDIDTVNITYDNLDPDSSPDCASLDTEHVVGGDSRIRVKVSASYQPIVPLVNIPSNITIDSDSVRTIVKDIALGEGGAPPAPPPSVCDPSVATVDFEADKSQLEDNGNISVAVNLTGAAEDDVTVVFSVTGGSASGGGVDYTINTSSPLTIPHGGSSATVTIEVVADGDDEPDETVELSMGAVTCATAGDTVHVSTIEDDDDPLPSPDPDVSITSGNSPIAEAGGVSTITVTLSEAHTSQDVTVNFGTGGTYEAGDFNLSDTSVTILQGDTQKTVTVTANDDADTDDEVVIVSINSATNADVGSPSTYSVTITDDDAAPTMHVADLSDLGSDGKNSNFWDANVTIRIVDGDGNLLENTSAGGTWSSGGSSSCTTDASGECMVTTEDLKRSNYSSAEFTVTSVVKASYTYESGDNVETSVIVSKN